MNISYRVELYNVWTKGRRHPVNGWLVARLANGCRAETVQRFGADETAAREMAAELNAAAHHCTTCNGTDRYCGYHGADSDDCQCGGTDCADCWGH